MTHDEFEKINRLENIHWWYVGTRKISMGLLTKFLTTTDNLKVLDIGCGTGGNMQALQILLGQTATIEGLDIDEYALEFCKEKNLNVSFGDLENTNKPNSQYDLVTIFDVLYQTDPAKHNKIFQELNRITSTNGLLLLREPSLQYAFGRHDLAVGTKMRFNKNYITQLLTNNGYRILRITYINTLLALPIILSRRIDYIINKTPKSDVTLPNKIANKILLKILSLENFLLRYINFGLGISIIVIAEKS